MIETLLAQLNKVKAEKIAIYQIGQVTSYADQMVIATLSNPRQLSAAIAYCKQALKENILHVEGSDRSDWVLIDIGSIIVHLFLPEARSHYGLDRLFEDCLEQVYELSAPSPVL